MKYYLLIFIGTSTLLACAPKMTEEIVEESSAMPAEVTQGKSVFSQKCSKCHDAPVVDNYSEEKWDKILPVMSDKAKLTEAERAQVEVYVNWELQH